MMMKFIALIVMRKEVMSTPENMSMEQSLMLRSLDSIEHWLSELIGDFLDSEDVKFQEDIRLLELDDEDIHTKMAKAAMRVYRDEVQPLGE